MLGEKAPRSHARRGLLGPDHIRTLSSRQVWKRWRMAPPAYELCVQRLSWYQSIAREPARNAHLLCCSFGRMHFESHDTLIESLRLHPEANGESTALHRALSASTRRKIAEKSTPEAITTQEGVDGYREQAMRIAGVEQVEWANAWSCQSRVTCSNGQDNRISLGDR